MPPSPETSTALLDTPLAEMEVFIPELVENHAEEKNKYDYRFLCPHAGQFMCKLTNLMFEMEGKGEVLYRIVSWDSCFLDGLDQMEPAGPLYSIDCHEGSIRHLHLPHCETCSDVVEFTVAHVTDGNVEIIQPLKVTNTHVIIDIEGLSLFGVLRALLYKGYSIKAQVLLFYKKIIGTHKMSKLHMHLLPQNVPVEEVQKRHECNTYIETSSKCKLTPGKKYQPYCTNTDHNYVFQPKVEEFERDYGPNYHPTFEVLFNSDVDKVTLGLLDENDQEVWEPRMVLLTGSEATSPKTDTTGADFVDQHREKLIQRVSSVMEIADYLKSKNMISDEMYNDINVGSTPYKQMRLLYRSLESGGRVVKAEVYKILKEKEPFLVDELESG
ncbi:NACHT, LRR and PYD domains-containing protein 1b allele 3-like [Neoarius graeffei]|uniref:NACHT, LRR and PYD domains-containing protein 1b allele 3-like n=1 Tax=Neoarius graeffei TaxID=443677 RepID=UPI00298CA361|nr:NACHT, LRR and PYD domains-containing protein 1b allele 3-like [Neoarius graeffei]